MKRESEREGEIKNIKNQRINEEGEWEGRRIFKF
jgi:hypothetical protein